MKRWPRVLPLLLVMGGIFYLSHQPGDTLTLPDLPSADKIVHCLVYGVLAACALHALKPEQRYTVPMLLWVLLFCVLYGGSDEFHQSFVPGRYPSLLDLAADTLGAALVLGGWWFWRASRHTPSSLTVSCEIHQP